MTKLTELKRIKSDILNFKRNHGSFIEYQFNDTQDQIKLKYINNTLNRLYVNNLFKDGLKKGLDEKLDEVIPFLERKRESFYTDIKKEIDNNLELKSILLLHSVFPLKTFGSNDDDFLINIKKILTPYKNDKVYDYILNKNNEVPQYILDSLKIFNPVQVDIDKEPLHIIFNHKWYSPIRVIFDADYEFGDEFRRIMENIEYVVI